MKLRTARLHVMRLGAARLAFAPAPILHPPIIVAPVNGAVHESLTPVLQWAPDPRDFGPFTYDVYFGETSDPPLVWAGLTVTQVQTYPLIGDWPYYWRVVGHNQDGPGSSPQVSFTTGPRFASVVINGIDVTLDQVSANVPMRYEDVLDGRSTLSLTFDTTVGEMRDLEGAEIIVFDGNTRVFGGMLVEPSHQVFPGTDREVVTCQATDYSAICDHRLVARAYTGQTLGAIVRHIVATDLLHERIDPSGVEPGPLVVKAIFNWVSCTEAFNQLAELSGMAWWIDPYRVLHFRERHSIPASGPFTKERVGSVTVRTDRQVYRNHQILRFSGGLTDLRTESYVGDGKRQTFTLAFPAGTEPIVRVDDQVQQVGIKGVETLKDWYWNKGSADITQDDGKPPLRGKAGQGAEQSMFVTYRGLFDGIISAADGAEIQRRAAVEGGSGRYMKVEARGSNVQTMESAIQVAQATLDRYGTIGRVLTVRTEIPGYAPGQLVPVTLPEYGIVNELFLIDSVSADITPGVDAFWYQIRALSGDPYGGWQTYFRRLQADRRDYVLNENEVVINLTQWADTALARDAVTATPMTPTSRIGQARIGYSIVGPR